MERNLRRAVFLGLSFASFTTAVQVGGAPPCESTAKVAQRRRSENFRWQLGPGVTDKDRADIETTLGETKRLLGSFLPVPSVATVSVSRLEDRAIASFDPEKNEYAMRIGIQDVEYSGPPRMAPRTVHPRFARASWIHEFTHLSQYSALNYHALLGRMKNSLEAEFDAMAEEIQFVGDPSRAAVSEARIETRTERAPVGPYRLDDETLLAFQKEFAAIYARREARLNVIFRAVKELYADLVPGVQLGDIDIMVKSFPSAGVDKDQRRKKRARAFTQRDPLSWELYDGTHAAFSTVRKYIGSIAGPYLKSDPSKIDFLRRTDAVLRAQLDAWADSPDLTTFDAKEVNDRLIAALRKEFSPAETESPH